MPVRPLRPREVVRRLERAGFVRIRQRGSHVRLRNNEGLNVSVPFHPGDVPLYVMRRILQQAGLTEEEWDAL